MLEKVQVAPILSESFRQKRAAYTWVLTTNALAHYESPIRTAASKSIRLFHGNLIGWIPFRGLRFFCIVLCFSHDEHFIFLFLIIHVIVIYAKPDQWVVWRWYKNLFRCLFTSWVWFPLEDSVFCIVPRFWQVEHYITYFSFVFTH